MGRGVWRYVGKERIVKDGLVMRCGGGRRGYKCVREVGLRITGVWGGEEDGSVLVVVKTNSLEVTVIVAMVLVVRVGMMTMVVMAQVTGMVVI